MNYTFFNPLTQRTLFTFFFLAVLAFSCSEDDDPKEDDLCSDGVMNGSETGIDCGGDCEPCDEKQPAKTYYIRFKTGDEVHLYEAGEPGYQSCGSCACSIIPVLADDNANIQVCNHDFPGGEENITAADIQSWNGKTYPFENEDSGPLVQFGFSKDDAYYSTGNAADQEGSSVKITSVEEDGTFGGVKKMYKVSGTFTCKLNTFDGDEADIAVTEGTFVVRYSED